MDEILFNPLFGIMLSVVAFRIGIWVNQKLRTPLANPLIIAMILIIGILKLFGIPLEAFEKGSSVISMFLAPATASLGVTVYRQRNLLKQDFLPIVLGTFAGSLAALFSVKYSCALLGLDDVMLASLLSKSVTTPIAIAITNQFGGLPALTVASTVISGLLGNLLAPVFPKLFFVKDPVAHGVGIGSCSHALGTSKALEIGEIQGAMSSIAISLSGICTVLLAPLFL